MVRALWNRFTTRVPFTLPWLRWISLHLLSDDKWRPQVCLPNHGQVGMELIQPMQMDVQFLQAMQMDSRFMLLLRRRSLPYPASFYSWFCALHCINRCGLLCASLHMRASAPLMSSLVLRSRPFASFGHLSPLLCPLGASMPSFLSASIVTFFGNFSRPRQSNRQGPLLLTSA